MTLPRNFYQSMTSQMKVCFHSRGEPTPYLLPPFVTSKLGNESFKCSGILIVLFFLISLIPTIFYQNRITFPWCVFFSFFFSFFCFLFLNKVHNATGRVFSLSITGYNVHSLNKINDHDKLVFENANIEVFVIISNVKRHNYLPSTVFLLKSYPFKINA